MSVYTTAHTHTHTHDRHRHRHRNRHPDKHTFAPMATSARLQRDKTFWRPLRFSANLRTCEGRALKKAVGHLRRRVHELLHVAMVLIVVVLRQDLFIHRKK
jgi:hypothetical protein